MSPVVLTRPSGPIRTAVRLPRSKSAANRALIIASLLGDPELVQDPGDGDDTRVLLRLLRERPHDLHCGAGGTTFRFLLAWAAVQEGEEHLLTGVPRLMERPHDDLVQALRTLGAAIEKVPEGYRVKGTRLKGGTVHFDSPISSQYLSALLLIAPVMENGLRMHWTGTRLSEPYVRMTLKLLAHFGVFPYMEMDGVRVEPGPFLKASCTVPPDWSAAAFWYEQVALSAGSEVLLAGLDNDTLQGDREAQNLWAPWVETTFTPEGARLKHRDDANATAFGPVDLRPYPDLFQPLVVTLAGRGIDASFEGLDNLRVKETDRLQAVALTLGKLGHACQVKDGTFTLKAKKDPGDATSRTLDLDPQGDHRMAMSFAPLALKLGSVTIQDPAVVDKSYPAFWEDLRKAGYAVE